MDSQGLSQQGLLHHNARGADDGLSQGGAAVGGGLDSDDHLALCLGYHAMLD
jgi:hypothetical protein